MEDVIGRAREGDADALGHLWRAYQHQVLRYLRGRGVPDPDDVASAVWVDVARSIPRFEGDETDFRRWLFTIAARRRVDELRRVHRRDAATRTATEHADAPARRPAADAADVADQAAALDRALRLVRRLPDDQAEAVLLRVVADLSVSDVAAIMSKREGHVRVLVHRGLAKLSEFAVTDRPPGAMYAL